MSATRLRPAPLLRTNERPLCRALRMALLGTAFATALQCGAQAADATTLGSTTAAPYLIQAGPLGRTLSSFALISGLALSFDPVLTEGLNSPGLSGSYTPQTAVQLLLSGSGLEMVARTDGSYTLRKRALAPSPANASGAAGTTLNTVTVSAAAVQQGPTEETGSYTAASASTATRLNLTPQQTPQSISVFTRQQIEDRAALSIEDVAQQTTGLTLWHQNTQAPHLISRGFEISTVMVDGMPANLDATVSSVNTLAMYDSAEVVRGAAGLLLGTGDPSGTINLVRKRPTKERKVALSTSYGSWNNLRTELDAGGALNEEGTLRGRAVLAWQDTDSFTDYTHNDRKLAYATLEADIARDTTLSLGFFYNDEKNSGTPWYATPLRADGSLLPRSLRRSANYAPSWSFYDKTNARLFAELEQRWDGGWKSKLSGYVSNSNHEGLGSFMTTIPNSSNMRLNSISSSVFAMRERGLDAMATGPFSLAGREHELVVGASFRNRYYGYVGEGGAANFVFDPLQPGPIGDAPQTPFDYIYSGHSDTEQYGTYATARLNMADSLKLIVGGRLDWYQDESTFSSPMKFSRKFTPYAGLVHDLDENYALYASWTKIFKPQDYRGAMGELLPPTTGSNYEVGVKGVFFGGALNTSAALFKIVQDNLPKALDDSACAPTLNGCYTPAGEAASKGLELEVSGQPAKRWQLAAGYTYNVARYTKAADAADQGARYATDQPRHLFKLSTNYQLPGALAQWRLGGSVRMQNSIYKTNGTVDVQLPGFAVFDLMAAWQVNRHLDVRLNLFNVFDRYYYASLGNRARNATFGAPRSALLTARYQF